MVDGPNPFKESDEAAWNALKRLSGHVGVFHPLGHPLKDLARATGPSGRMTLSRWGPIPRYGPYGWVRGAWTPFR